MGMKTYGLDLRERVVQFVSDGGGKAEARAPVCDQVSPLVFQSCGNTKVMDAYFEKALLLEPTNAIYHQRLGAVNLALKETMAAERQFKQALALDPQNISLHIFLSQYYFSKGSQEEFNFHLDKILQLYHNGIRDVNGPLDTAVKDFLKSVGRQDLI